MMKGIVTEREPVMRLIVEGPGGKREIEAVVDTGYTGSLTLPPDTIAELNLRTLRQSRALLADGSEITFDVYEAAVEWQGHRQRVVVDEADTTPLIGMGLLEGCELHVEVREGGRVTAEVLPA